MSKKMRKKSPSSGTQGSTRGRVPATVKGSGSASRPQSTAIAKAARPTAKRQAASITPPAEPRSPKKTASPGKAKTPSVAKAPVLVEGARAPAFRLQRDGGAEISLNDYEGQKLVIFFYPRANTPGCTREAVDFTRLSDLFAAADTAILGVSADSLRAQESFRDKHDLSVPLLSDTTHQMLEVYGVWGEKSMYGRAFLGILRTTVLINRDGRVNRIWRNVRVDGHAQEVLEAARKL